MRRTQTITNIITAAFALCMAWASSWYGALLYVRSYPQIVEYVEPITAADTAGNPARTLKPGQSFILRGLVRRQPYSCWGSFTYGIKSTTVNFQFPAVRSQSLESSVHHYTIKHLMTLPAALPDGHYRLFVTVYPTCDGVDTRPVTIDFDSWIDVNS